MTIDHIQSIETPFYLYDMALLDKTIQTIKNEIVNDPDFHIHYAIKANANPRILGAIFVRGIGADCVSGGEIEAALMNGVSAPDIVFAGVGKNDHEIRLALNVGIGSFNVESLPELEVINQLAAEANTTARIAFRVNPNIDAHTHAKITTGTNENKFGIAREDLLPAIYMAQGLSNVEYIGLHFHIGSQILDLEVYKRLCERINEIQDDLEKEGIVTSSINVGGGLGIDYTTPEEHPIPDFPTYFSIFRKNLKRRANQEIHFELGRSIVGQCGNLISRVLYVKQGHTKRFLIVDAGFTDLIRPAMYDAIHPTKNLSNPNGSEELYDIVGPICESSDTFAKDIMLPTAKRGDMIAFGSAGAYGEAMASCYNGRKLPSSYFLEGGFEKVFL